MHVHAGCIRAAEMRLSGATTGENSARDAPGNFGSHWLTCLWTRESPPRYGEACNEDKRQEKKKGTDTGESSLLMERWNEMELRVYSMHETRRRDNVTVVTVRSQVVCSGD